MANKHNSTGADEWVQWIEDGISKYYLNYYEYNEFQNIKRIGSGAFSNVYKAHWKSSNTVVALKSFRNDSCVTEIVNELQLLHVTQFHAHIIRFFGITKRKYNEDNVDPDYLLILEYADSGTLRNYLKENFNKLDWNMKLQFAIQIADA
ncbi:kinase-like domain-containing protein, partial [Glomus cerebriforme]